ncbi:hypothetical protein BS47DRAFT_1366581 [Hydnum rufescens UP504]|uniref:Pre-mRNA-processing factor 19 n=1 Tax=Hydnum rufescens UP504 TaxID=1448309 RepID=A0A9P6AKP3_9AGAM|nr:hypothetical protein BS47DRAFT_1366581 [Hydnum rufescens UP504]
MGDRFANGGAKGVGETELGCRRRGNLLHMQAQAKKLCLELLQLFCQIQEVYPIQTWTATRIAPKFESCDMTLDYCDYFELSSKSEHLYKHHFIENYVSENGTDPMTGERPMEEDLIPIKTRHLYECHLIEKYILENGTDPITGEDSRKRI